MSESRKDRIIAALEQAKQTGELKSEKIREIVKTAISQMAAEVKEGRSEISALVQDAIAAVVETFKEKSGEIKDEIAASIEGAIEGVSSAKRQEIAQTQAQIQNLQTKAETEEQQLQQEIDGVLTDLQGKGNEEPEWVKTAIESAIKTVKDSEEVAVLQRRYARLKVQLAILQANLASRYGERYEEAKQYLDEAKNWYERAKEDPEVFTDKVAHKRAEFEQKLSEAGTAVARKERKVKQLMGELWTSITEIFRDR